MRKEQEIPSFHQAVLCLASDVVCSSWIPDGTLHRAGIGAHTSLLIVWYQCCWSNTPHTHSHPLHVRSLCLDSKSSEVVVLTTSRKAEADGDNTNVLLPALWGHRQSRLSVPVMRPPLQTLYTFCLLWSLQLSLSKFARYLSRYFPH